MATFRDQVVERFIAEFGEPQTVQTVDGAVYRWVLKTNRDDVIRLTIDAPEFPSMAHLLVSDRAAVIDPLSSIPLRTMPEAEEVVARVQLRLHGEGQRPSR
jgi:hypothetical protein